MELSATVDSGKGKYEVSTDGTWLNASYIVSTEVEINEYCTQEISFKYTLSIKNNKFDSVVYEKESVEAASSKVMSKVSATEVLENILVAAMVIVVGAIIAVLATLFAPEIAAAIAIVAEFLGLFASKL